MSAPMECPSCKADLQGAEILPEYKQYYGDATHFSDVIGMIKNDRHVGWRCPHCHHMWTTSGTPSADVVLIENLSQGGE